MRSDLDVTRGRDAYLTPPRPRPGTRALKWFAGASTLTAATLALWLSELEWNPATTANAFSIAPYSEGYVPPIETVDDSVEGDARLTRIEIQRLQSALQMRGFRPGPIDGVAGPRTLAALNAYRTSNDFLEVREISRDATLDLLP